MKKSVSLLLCAVLILTLTAAFGGCAKQPSAGVPDRTDGGIAGTWRTVFDMGNLFEEVLTQGDETMEEYVQLDNFMVDLLFVFDPDGTYVLTVDEASVDSSSAALKEDFIAGITAMFADMIEEEGYSLSVEEFLALCGIDMEQVIDEILSEETLYKIFSYFELEGQYVFTGDRLYTTSDPDTPVDESVLEYFVCTLEGDVMTFTECITTDEEAAELVKGIIPMVLRKEA